MAQVKISDLKLGTVFTAKNGRTIEIVEKNGDELTLVITVGEKEVVKTFNLEDTTEYLDLVGAKVKVDEKKKASKFDDGFGFEDVEIKDESKIVGDTIQIRAFAIKAEDLLFRSFRVKAEFAESVDVQRLFVFALDAEDKSILLGKHKMDGKPKRFPIDAFFNVVEEEDLQEIAECLGDCEIGPDDIPSEALEGLFENIRNR